MDPDQADAAGDLADTATTSLDGGGCAGSEESWTRALLRRGWDLSLKAAIAGAAATAAPVVGPPILILSVAGVALSIPFAAYLASLAATDRLMSALLPPTPPQPCYTCYDVGAEEPEQDFMDASEAPAEEAPVFGHWSKAEKDAIGEQDESLASLPLSLEPRLSEELAPLLASEDGEVAEGEFAVQKSDQPELFAPDDGKQEENGTAMEVDNEYITMEAPSPGDVSGLAAPVLREEDSMVRGMEDASIPAMESVQVLSASDTGKKTEDGKSTITEEPESSKEFLSPGIDATESSVLALLMLGNDDIVVQREGEAEVSVSKSGQDSHVSDSGDKTEQHKTKEVMVPCEVNVSESSVPGDNTALSKILDELRVEMAPEQVMSGTDSLITGEVVDVQLDFIATAVPERESLQSNDQVACELQAVNKSAEVYDTHGSTSTHGVVKDDGDKHIRDVEHHGERDVCTVASVPSEVTEDDEKDLVSSWSTPYASAISDDTSSVKIRPHSDYPHQTTVTGNTKHGKEHVAKDKCVKAEENKSMDGKAPTTDMEAQDDLYSRPPVPDDRKMGDDEISVEMVLDKMISSIDPVTGEATEVQVDIIASESEPLPLGDLEAHDLQAGTKAGMVDAMNVIGDTNTKSVKCLSEGGACSSVSVTAVVTMDDSEDLMSNRSTQYALAISNDMMSIEGRPDVDHHQRTTDVGYKVMNEGFGMEELAEDKDIYTEEQLREQLDTLRTITGYRAVPSLTLEGDLAGLYIFVGVEPPHSAGDAPDLMELNMKLRFLKSIIGVE